MHVMHGDKQRDGRDVTKYHLFFFFFRSFMNKYINLSSSWWPTCQSTDRPGQGN